MDVVVYDNVVADPPEAIVNEAVDFAKDAGVDCVVGFGGGSVGPIWVHSKRV